MPGSIAGLWEENIEGWLWVERREMGHLELQSNDYFLVSREVFSLLIPVDTG